MITNTVIVLLIIIIILLLCESRYGEHFTQYKKCNEKPLRGIMKEIFAKY